MFVSPMLLQYSIGNKPYEGENTIAELKLDGIRLIVSNLDDLQLYTRHKNNVTRKFPELILNCPVPQGTILDGELIVTDEHGKPDFEAMMSRFHGGAKKVVELPVMFCAFDVIMFGGMDVTILPLQQRKEILEKAFVETEYYSRTRIVQGNNAGLFELVREQNLEGIVIKNLDSKYAVAQRSWDWQKVINYKYTDVYITGIRKNEFGWLTQVEDKGRLRPAGIIELGVPPVAKKAFSGVYRQVITGEDDRFIYLDPVLKARVKFREWTSKGLLRSPSFVEFIL